MADDPGHAGAVAIAIAGINALILTNGGAAVALLAFYGDVLSSGGGLASPTLLKFALIAFALGVFAGSACAILAYLSQLAWTTTRGASPSDPDTGWRLGAVLAGIASACLFLIGVILAALSL